MLQNAYSQPKWTVMWSRNGRSKCMPTWIHLTMDVSDGCISTKLSKMPQQQWVLHHHLAPSACSNDLNVCQNFLCTCNLFLPRIVRYGCSRDANTVAHQASQVAIKTQILLGMKWPTPLRDAARDAMRDLTRDADLIRIPWLGICKLNSNLIRKGFDKGCDRDAIRDSDSIFASLIPSLN